MEKNRIIAALSAEKISGERIQAFSNWKGTFEEYLYAHPLHLLWAYKHRPILRLLINESLVEGKLLISQCPEKFPSIILRYGAKYLPSYIIEECAYFDPKSALQYAKNLMSIYLRQWCKENANKK